MTVRRKRSYGLIVLLVLIGVVLAGYAPAVALTGTPTATPVPTPSLGDTWTRPADGMEMVHVPGGEFQMGSTDEQVEQAFQTCQKEYGDCPRKLFEAEQPLHTIALDAFWLDRTEVTNAQYRLCVEARECDRSGCQDDSDFFNGENQPVACVSWYDAQDYCQWAGARLPEGRVYPWGDTFDGTKLNFCDKNCPLDHADKSVDDGYLFRAPVGSYPDGASWCGALDIAGNVWEWVADWYDEDCYSRSPQWNPTGPTSGEQKVLRGGSWLGTSYDTRGATRYRLYPDRRFDLVGFRCARSF